MFVLLVFVILPKSSLFNGCKTCSDVKSKTLFPAVEMPDNLCMVVLLVSGVCGLLDLCNMCMLCDVSHPLHNGPRSTNGQYDML